MGLLVLPPFAIASLTSDLTLVAYFVVAELMVVFSTWAEVALEHYSRSNVLAIAAAGGAKDTVEGRLDRTGVYELSVRIVRFVGSALLVAGIAYVVLRDHLTVGTGVPSGFPWGPLAATLGVTFLVSFILNDLLIRFAARRNPDGFLVAALPYLEWLRFLTTPIRVPLALLVRALFRARLEEPGPTAREEVLESVEEGEREGSLTADEAEMIESIIDLDRATVDDVLTPRGEMAMVQADKSLAEAVQFVLESGRRRIPVYGKDRDDVLGVVMAFDLLEQMARPRPKERVRDVMRSPFFVPEGKPLNDLLGELRARRVSIAIVLNEFGGTAGLVTMEDVLEKIVGEIDDEHDREEPEPEVVRDGTLVVEGRTSIEEVNRKLSVSLPVQEDFETVGGLVFHRMGRVPRAGDELSVENVALTVTDADERTVKRVRVQVRTAPDG